MFKIFILLLAVSGEPTLLVSTDTFMTAVECESRREESVAAFVESNRQNIVPGMLVSKCFQLPGQNV